MDIADANGTVSTDPVIGGPFDEEPPQSMIERITSILDTFDRRSTRLTLEQISLGSQLPRSTVHRILDQLVKLEWVEHASFGYCLGRRFLGLNGGDDSRHHLREVAAPSLHELHLRTGMVVHLSVLDGCENVYLDKLGGRCAAAVPSRVGGRQLAHTTADGKAMLAWLDPERIDTMFKVTLPRLTSKTITDLAILHQELNRIRHRKGLAFECGESTSAVAGVAAAIHGYDGVVGSIALYGDVHDARLERVAPLVADAAHQVSRALYPDLGTRRRGRKSRSTPVKTFSAETVNRLLAESPQLPYF
ncbi:IclR family transcriptional regulator [Rhodococcus sp. 24CO]|uniref:IclR family transcriptional regulator n=1 Tax=Rhodococcus sp. 24CO TaxID=3117460 RepID=UPI003D32C748